MNQIPDFHPLCKLSHFYTMQVKPMSPPLFVGWLPRVLWGMDLKGWISLSFVDFNFIPFLATKDN